MHQRFGTGTERCGPVIDSSLNLDARIPWPTTISQAFHTELATYLVGQPASEGS